MDRTSHEVKTTKKSLRVIEALQELGGGRVTEVADHVGMAKSTAHKHLTTLERSGYLEKEGDAYQIGLRFLNLGEYARSRWPAAELIKESISVLSRRTDEEIDFVAEDHGRVLTVFESYHKWVKYDSGDEREADGTRYRAQIGTYYYSHATASGKAILTEYPRDRVERILDQWGLPPKTENTITDRETLFAELERIDRQGYAVDDEEYTAGLRSVGKAVTDPAGDVLGALSVSGPTYRMNGSVLAEEIPRTLADVVADLEADIDAADAY